MVAFASQKVASFLLNISADVRKVREETSDMLFVRLENVAGLSVLSIDFGCTICLQVARCWLTCSESWADRECSELKVVPGPGFVCNAEGDTFGQCVPNRHVMHVLQGPLLFAPCICV